MTTVELGPWLGRLVSPPDPAGPAEALLSGVRLQLLTQIFETGEWLAAWEHAVTSAGPLIADEVEARIRHAARTSRYPARRLDPVVPTPEDRQILAARLSAGGVGLEQVARHSALGSRQLLDTQAEVRAVCGELEVAWNGLVTVANAELAAADRTADRIRAWKRPLAPLLVIGAVWLGIALWTGLVLGGYLNSPAWFRPVAEWVWSW